MQTFVPDARSYRASLACLDNTRLGNQVYREGLTLLRGGWANHPAAKMWKGFEHQLAAYCLAGACEMHSRFACKTGPWKKDIVDKWVSYFSHEVSSRPYTPKPSWWGDARVHDSHKSNLLRKNPEYYAQHYWHVDQEMPYYWPI